MTPAWALCEYLGLVVERSSLGRTVAAFALPSKQRVGSSSLPGRAIFPYKSTFFLCGFTCLRFDFTLVLPFVVACQSHCLSLRLIDQHFGPLRSPHPDPWLPYVFTSLEQAAEAGVCNLL